MGGFFPFILVAIVSFHIQSIKSAELKHQMLLQSRYLWSSLHLCRRASGIFMALDTG